MKKQLFALVLAGFITNGSVKANPAKYFAENPAAAYVAITLGAVAVEPFITKPIRALQYIWCGGQLNTNSDLEARVSSLEKDTEKQQERYQQFQEQVVQAQAGLGAGNRPYGHTQPQLNINIGASASANQVQGQWQDQNQQQQQTQHQASRWSRFKRCSWNCLDGFLNFIRPSDMTKRRLYTAALAAGGCYAYTALNK